MTVRIRWLALLALLAGSRVAHAQTLVHAFDAYAEALTTVQDLTSDGIPELVLAGHVPVSTYSQKILVELHDGGSGAMLARTVLNSSGGGSWRVSIANVGDVDGDNADEFAVGDAMKPALIPTFPLGAVHVFNSRSFLVAPATALIASFGSSSEIAIDTQYGWSVAGVGDQNGDGLDDIAVGAPLAIGNRGRVEVVGWQPGSPTGAQLLQTSIGDNFGDRLGEAVVGLGAYDCNDLVPDYAVGMPGVQRVRVFANPGPSDLLPPWSLQSFGAVMASMDSVGARSRLFAIGAPGDVCASSPYSLGSRWAIRHNTGCGTGNYVQFEQPTSCVFPLAAGAIAGFYGNFCGPNCFGPGVDCMFNVVGGVTTSTPTPNGYAVVTHADLENGSATYCFTYTELHSPIAGANSFGAAVTGIVHASGVAWVAVSDFRNHTVYVYAK